MDRPDEQSSEVVERNQALDELPLFRQEIVAARQNQWLGTVLLAPKISQSLIAAFAALSIVGVLGLLFLGEYTSKERITGWLVPEKGLVRVLAPQSGVITKLHVRDGETVMKGAPLVTLSTEIQSKALGATQKEIVNRLKRRRSSLIADARRQNKMLRGELDALARQIASVRTERINLGREIDIQRSHTKLARRVEMRLRGLHGRGMITAARLESAEANRLDQNLKLQALVRQHAEAEHKRLILEAQRKALPLASKSRIAEIGRNITVLEENLAAAEARRKFVILAAQSGTVTALRAVQGSSVDTSIPLLSILPAGSELSAQLFVPSSAIGFIRTGQRVLLRYQAFPYQKFGHHQGKVNSVSRSTVSPKDLGTQLAGITSLVSGAEPVYLVTVKLARQSVTAYGNAVPLQPGMQLKADVLIEKRRLIEWVFDPLFTLTGRPNK